MNTKVRTFSLDMQTSKQFGSAEFSPNDSSKMPVNDFPTEGEKMTLEHLIEKYGDHIPLCFRVIEGFLAENEKDPTLDVDDVYNAHLVKHTEVVSFQDKAGDEYNVPLYSAAKFGILYQGTKQMFASVGELMDAVPVPKIVAVKSGFSCSDSKSASVKRNEVLVITEVRHKPKFAHTGKSWLKVFSVTNSEEKKLLRECEAKFTTDPHYTKLYVNDLIQHVPNLLPCKVRLFQDSNTSLPQQLTSDEVILQKKRRNTSVVVSLVRGSGIRKENDFIDIPTSIGITVTVVNPENHKETYQNLYTETTTLHKDFDPAKLQPCVDARTDDTYVNQAQLLSAVREDCKNVGLEIQSQYQELVFSTRNDIGPYEDISFDNKPPTNHHKVNTTTTTKPTAAQRPVPLKRSAPPTKNTPPVKSRAAQAPTCKIPQLPPKTQSLPRNALKNTMGDLPVDNELAVNGPAMKPKKKPILVPVHSVDCRDTASVYEDVYFQSPVPSSGQQVEKPVNTTIPTEPQRPVPSKRSTPPIKNASTAKTTPLSLTPGYDVPRPQPKAQVSQEHPVVELSADIIDGDAGHPMKHVVKPKKKPIPLAQPKPSQSTDVNDQLKTLQRSLDELSSRVKVLEMQQLLPQNRPSTQPGRVSSAEGSVDHIYTQDLESFNSTKIQQLLEMMNLHSYKELFAKEKIDGVVLKELSEDDLTRELGMTSKIHRLRLMKVIKGYVSAGDVLSGKVTV